MRPPTYALTPALQQGTEQETDEKEERNERTGRRRRRMGKEKGEEGGTMQTLASYFIMQIIKINQSHIETDLHTPTKNIMVLGRRP